MKFVLLVIWMGVGSNQVLDVERFDTMEECEIARSALLRHDFMGRDLRPSAVECVEAKGE